jgi:hypothetical protein
MSLGVRSSVTNPGMFIAGVSDVVPPSPPAADSRVQLCAKWAGSRLGADSHAAYPFDCRLRFFERQRTAYPSRNGIDSPPNPHL